MTPAINTKKQKALRCNDGIDKSNDNDKKDKDKDNRVILSQSKFKPKTKVINASPAKFAIIFQLFSRISTFLMNNLIARSTSVAHVGLISMKLDLVNNSILSLSRDGIRMALLRGNRDDLRGAWICVPLALLIGIIIWITSIYLIKEPEILLVLPEFKLALGLYVLAAIIEGFTEEPVVWCMTNQRSKERIGIESMALMIKVSFILVKIHRMKSTLTLNTNENLSLLLKTFSRAQIIYAMTLNASYWLMLTRTRTRTRTRTHTNRTIQLEPIHWKLPSPKFLSLACALTKQNFFKFFLAQGDLIIIGRISSLQDQGVYGMISNYGSLVLRLLMQPIEETSLQFFSRELASFPMNEIDDKVADDSVESLDSVNVTKLKSVIEYFNLMLKTMIYLCLFFICFGTFFTDPLLSVLLGRIWVQDTGATEALSVYCWLVGVAGISGFLESFTHAIINEKWMTWQRGVSLTCSFIYCILAGLLIVWKGPIGLIMAGTINFTLRAVTNAFLVQKYFFSYKIKNFWIDCLVPKSISFSFVLIFLTNFVLYISYKDDWCLRISIGVVLIILIILFIIKKDVIFVKKFISHWFG